MKLRSLFQKKWKEFCFNYSLFQGEGRTVENSPSIDRIDSNLGYVKGNVMVMSHKANRLKSNGTIEELKLVVKFLEAQQ